MPVQTPPHFRKQTTMVWLGVISVHGALVAVALAFLWRGTSDGNHEDQFVPTIEFVESSQRPVRIHGGGSGRHGTHGRSPNGHSKGSQGWQGVATTGIRCPGPVDRKGKRRFFQPVSISESLAISDTWGTDVELPISVTRPFNPEVLVTPSNNLQSMTPWEEAIYRSFNGHLSGRELGMD